jgi:hypothetical protein
MNGVQIEHILYLLEEKSAAKNRPMLRREVVVYLEKHITEVARRLVEVGEVTIPTSFGGIRLTTADLELAAA